MTALGACIFGGAFSFGVERAGFKVAGHFELKDLALGAATSRQRWPVHVSDYDGWMAAAAWLRADGHVPHLVYANPPCVAYAGTGKHMGTADERMCFTRYCSYGLAFALKPTTWVWELVPGILTKELGFLQAMAYRASREGYRCWAFLTSSALHGGFQDRRRFHFVASKFDLQWEPVFNTEPPLRSGVRMLSDALEVVAKADTSLSNNEPAYKGAFKDIMPFCPPGSHLGDLPDEVLRNHYRPRGMAWTGTGRPGFAHTRGRMDRPSPNVMGGHTIIHPIEDRYLSPRACATIQGFPLDYKFSPGTTAYAEIGKGLCTHNAEFVARVIRIGIEVGEPVKPDGLLHVVDWRNRAPSLKLSMPVDDQRAWFAAKHPNEPVPKLLGGRRHKYQIEEMA